jgi:hypothetical protein
VLLGVVGDRDALVAGERPDHDVGVLLLHQATRLLDRLVSRVVRAAVADDLHVLAGDLGAGHAVARLLAGRLRARELDERGVGTRDRRLEERAERAFAVRQEADLDRASAARLLARAGATPAGVLLVVAAAGADQGEGGDHADQRP